MNNRSALRGRAHAPSQSLAGPWSAQQDIAPEATRTWYSQNAYDLPLGSSAIYMGDRWRPDLLGSSRYIWYPLDFSSGAPQIVHADVWSVNVQAGACARLPCVAASITLRASWIRCRNVLGREWDDVRSRERTARRILDHFVQFGVFWWRGRGISRYVSIACFAGCSL